MFSTWVNKLTKIRFIFLLIVLRPNCARIAGTHSKTKVRKWNQEKGRKSEPAGVISITPTLKSKTQNDLLKNTASGICIRVLAVMHIRYT